MNKRRCLVIFQMIDYQRHQDLLKPKYQLGMRMQSQYASRAKNILELTRLRTTYTYRSADNRITSTLVSLDCVMVCYMRGVMLHIRSAIR